MQRRNANGQFTKLTNAPPKEDLKGRAKYYYRVVQTNKVRYRIHLLRCRIQGRKKGIVHMRRKIAISLRLITEMQAEIKRLIPYREQCQIKAQL